MLPFNNQLVLKENRDIDFDGKVFAGFTTLLGTGFHFNYNKFQIDLDSPDTLTSLFQPAKWTNKVR
ncbi:MAG: hypothetical protein R2769_10720 [Saprospiraceae bacterium]